MDAARSDEILEIIVRDAKRFGGSDAAILAATSALLSRVIANTEREIRELRAELTGRERQADLTR